jgi:hypothetical protein
MRVVPNASALGSFMYVMLCTRPYICFAVGMVSKYKSNTGPPHWVAVKHIIKYLCRMKDYMLVYHCEDLTTTSYTDFDFQSDHDSRKSTSTSGYVYTLGGGPISWRSVKQSRIVDSTMEAEYVASCEVAKEVVWLRKFLVDLGVMRIKQSPIMLF